MNPVISIIIPCYNHGQYIQEAISSVEQFADKSVYEIIIINDGSTDDYTKSVLNSLQEKGYYVVNQENQGLARARNNGIVISKGKFFLPLDSDNKIRAGYIEKSISILDSDHTIGIVYGDSLYFGEENKFFKAGKFSLRKLLTENYIDACVVMRKEAWKETNGYDPHLSALEDWDMNLSLAELGWGFYYIPEIMFEYRIRKDSMARTYTNRDECRDYIARKHGALYRAEFIKTITIKSRLKVLLNDIWQKLIGKPNY